MLITMVIMHADEKNVSCLHGNPLTVDVVNGGSPPHVHQLKKFMVVERGIPLILLRYEERKLSGQEKLVFSEEYAFFPRNEGSCFSFHTPIFNGRASWRL